MDESSSTHSFYSEPPSPEAGRSPTPRPFVGVLMKCCRTYVRAYLNAGRDAFVGWCPKCAAKVEIEAVEEGGSTSRFFEAS
jgi:hypothetical protein